MLQPNNPAAASTNVTNTSVMEGELPLELLTQLDALNKMLKENKQLYTDIKDTKPASQLVSLEAKMVKLAKLIGQQKNIIRRERLKSAGLAEKIGLDQRIAQNVQRSREQAGKSPQYGRVHSLDYLHEVASLNESQLDQLWGSVQQLRQLLERLQRDEDPVELSRSDLAAHIQRFDNIFESVALQVYTLSESTEKLRDNYLEQRKDIFGGPFGVSPFEKRKERQRLIDAYSSLKGVDAFPSPNAILSLSEYLPKQQTAPAQAQFGTTPFGQPMGGGASSLFGGAMKQGPAFSFNLPSAASSSAQGAGSLFGTAQKPGPGTLFGASAAAGPPSSSLFGTATATSSSAPSVPLFGAGPASQPSQSASSSAGVQPPPFGFSNTLSSASSGTLFKGSATPQPQSKIGGGSLFGGLTK